MGGDCDLGYAGWCMWDAYLDDLLEILLAERNLLLERLQSPLFVP